jgi:DNA-binding SARP family transcriptional activator
MADIGRLYEFVYRATLTEEALDKAGRRLSRVTDESMADIAAALSLELLDAEEIAAANRMAVVYTGIAAFENAARRFVSRVLQDGHGDNWLGRVRIGKDQEICGITARRRRTYEMAWHAR